MHDMKRSMVAVAVCVGAMWAGGCETVELDEPGEVTVREAASNGITLNSAQLNGWSLNGWSLNGWSLNGWSLNGWSLNGWSLNGWSLNGSAFSATQLVDGHAVSLHGPGLIGSLLTLRRDGVDYTLRFDDIYKDPQNPNGDVYFHKVSVHDPVSDTWSSLCRDAQGQPTEAIALSNHWNLETGARIDDPNAVTLACRGAVLAKCVEWGYRPWASFTSCAGSTCTQVPLADHHQACTRLARADYCGDGTPHTLDGTPIDLYDRLTVQTEASTGIKEWLVEAEWGPNGAVCLGNELRVDMFDELGVTHADPTCRAALQKLKVCGDFSSSRGAKLANRYCDEWISDPRKCEPHADK